MSTPSSGEPPYPGSQPNQPGHDPNQGYTQSYQGGYGAGPPAQPRNGMGIAALVLGLLALLSFFTIIGGLLLGLLALIFGIIGLRRVGKGRATNKGVAIAGIVLGLLGLIASIVFIAVGTSVFFSTGGDDLIQCMQQAGGDQAQMLQCQQQFQQGVQDQVGGY